MDYKVVITEDAEADLEAFIQYLLFVLKNEQVAKNLMDDFERSQEALAGVAGSLRYCDNPDLSEQGYRRMNFLSHRYFMLYRLEEDTAVVDNIFHELQDYENRLS